MIEKAVKTYSAVREYFRNLVVSNDIHVMSNLNENRDCMVLKLSFNHDGRTLDYYYRMNEHGIHRFVDDTDERVISTKPEFFSKVISRNIAELAANDSIA